MDFTTIPDAKTLVDLGLGGMSLLLWLRQGTVNKKQIELDQRQNKVTEDLTVMVKDHEGRLVVLEKTKRCKRAKRPKKARKAK